MWTTVYWWRTKFKCSFSVSAMGAVVSSVDDVPITAIILILELTNSYQYAIASILPIAFSI